MYYLIKLKNLLQYKYFILLLLIICLSFTRINNKSIYNINETNFYGVVIDYQYKDGYISLILKGKEKLKCNYYLDNNEKINIKYGDKLYVNGKLKKPNNNTIPNTFNYKKYLEHNDIYYILEIDKINKQLKTNNIIYKIKNILKSRIDKYDHTGYLNAFILGNKNNIDNETYSNYSKNGIIHIFSISGMHISLLASIILSLLNKINKNNKNVLVVIMFLIFYLILTNYQASIIRSIIFYIVINLFKLKKVKVTTLDSFLISISLILLFIPKFIYNIGFLYSSSVSFSLIFYKNKFNKNYVMNLLYVSFISFLISLPITVSLNYQVNLLSIIINLLFVPLVSFILYPLSLIVFVFPIFISLFNFFISITEFLSNNISNISFFDLFIPKMNLTIIIIYYLLVYLLLSKNIKWLIVFCFYIFVIKNINVIDNSYYVYFLDVGQGDMSVIKYKNECIVIDTGPSNVYKSTYKITDNHIKFLHSIGVNNIDLLIISHGDNDHIGNANYLVNNFRVKNVSFNSGDYNELEIGLIKLLKDKKINYFKDNEIKYSNKIKYLYLNTKVYDNENDNSSVVYLKIYKYNFLFMGDASIEKEKDILNKYDISNIDFLKVGHHGSNTSSSKEFINRIKVKYSLISVGKNNRYGHPKESVIDTLKSSKIYRTDEDGSIEIKIKSDCYSIETYSP